MSYGGDMWWYSIVFPFFVFLNIFWTIYDFGVLLITEKMQRSLSCPTPLAEVFCSSGQAQGTLLDTSPAAVTLWRVWRTNFNMEQHIGLGWCSTSYKHDGVRHHTSMWSKHIKKTRTWHIALVCSNIRCCKCLHFRLQDNGFDGFIALNMTNINSNTSLGKELAVIVIRLVFETWYGELSNSLLSKWTIAGEEGLPSCYWAAKSNRYDNISFAPHQSASVFFSG